MKKLFLVVLFIILVVPVVVFGAAFTSTQTGDWNDGATWGNTSPGVKGTDWPGSAGDTFTIADTHTVTYNVSEANELSDSVIQSGGVLTFKIDTNTSLNFGDAKLTVNNGGTLNIGTSGTPVGSGNTAELYFNTTANDQDGLNILGTVNMYGSADYYGSDFMDTLENNAENTDGDSAIMTVTDMSATWAVGQYLMIHEHKDYGVYTTDFVFRVIDSFDGCDGRIINLTGGNVTAAAGVGDTWTGRVYNVSRNVLVGKASLTPSAYAVASNKPHFRTQATTGAINLYNMSLTGCEPMEELHAITTVLDKCVFSNGEGVFGLDVDDTMTDCIVFGGSPSIDTFDGGTVTNCHVIGCYHFETDCRNTTFDGCTILGNAGSNDGYSNTAIDCIFGANGHSPLGARMRATGCYFYGQDYDYQDPHGVIINCIFGYDENLNSIPSTSNFVFSSVYSTDAVLINCKAPLVGYVYQARNVTPCYGHSGIHHEHYDQILNDHRSVFPYGDTRKIDCDGTGDWPSVDPDGLNGEAIEVIAQSLCSVSYSVRVFEHEYWKTAASHTVTYKLQTTFAAMSAGDIKMEIDYLDGSGDVQTATEEATVVTARANAADWTQSISDTFTVGTEGWVRIRLYLQDYEENDELYVWPEASWS